MGQEIFHSGLCHGILVWFRCEPFSRTLSYLMFINYFIRYLDSALLNTRYLFPNLVRNSLALVVSNKPFYRCPKTALLIATKQRQLDLFHLAKSVLSSLGTTSLSSCSDKSGSAIFLKRNLNLGSIYYSFI